MNKKMLGLLIGTALGFSLALLVVPAFADWDIDVHENPMTDKKSVLVSKIGVAYYDNMPSNSMVWAGINCNDFFSIGLIGMPLVSLYGEKAEVSTRIDKNAPRTEGYTYMSLFDNNYVLHRSYGKKRIRELLEGKDRLFVEVSFLTAGKEIFSFELAGFKQAYSKLMVECGKAH